MQKLKRPVSVILSILMVVSMFVVVPFTASAAVGDYLSESEYLTFTAEEAGSSVTLNVASGSNLQYNKNNSGWEDYTAGTTITLANAGDSVRFRGKDTTFDDNNHVSIGGKVACSGNVMSLRLDDNGEVQGLSERCFNSMFMECTGLTAAPELPETMLANSCYDNMFSGCTSLTTAPELPATTLARYCYNCMFIGCTSLTTAPVLPATTLEYSCYSYMFYGCERLTTAPELPATSLADYCYSYMFYDCKNLTTAPELPATTLADNCYSYMFYGCSSIKLSETQTDEYSKEYRVPSEGTGTTASSALTNMFARTGGTFTGTPDINKTYYVPANYVAEVNGTQYETLEAAIEAAQTGDTVLVVNEITDLSQITIPAGKKITLDLGNQKVSGDAGLFKVPYGTSLTVQNGTLESVATNGYAIYVASNDEKGGTFVLKEDATIKTTGTGSGAVRGYADANITINGTIDAATYGVVVTKSAKLTVNSPAVIKGSENAIASNGNSGNGGYTITIKGGTIGTDDTNTAIYHQNNGTLTINGGTVKGKTAVYVKSGKTTINGGTFISTKNPGENYSYNGNGTNSTGDTIVVDNCGYPGGAPTIAIKGGTFNVTDTANANPVASYSYGAGNEEVEEFVSGGTFNRAVPAEYCAPAYTPADNVDGTYGVSLTYVAQVGNTKYETFAEAVTAADGSVINMLATDTTPYVMSVGQVIVVDNYSSVTIVAPEGAYAINRAYDSTAKTYTFTVIDAIASLTVGGTTTYYSSLNAAISAAPNSSATPAEVNLLRDSTELAINVGTASAKKNVVIDLGDNTLTLNRNYSALFIVRNGSTAVVKNGKVVFDTVYDNASGFYIYDNATKLTLADDLDVEATGNTAGVLVKNGTFTSAADITAENSFAIATNGSQTSNATINVTGGTLTSDTVAVYLPGDATATFTDANVTGSTAIYVKSGDVTINSGTYTANGAAADYTYNGNGANATGDAIVVDSCGYPGGAPEVSIGGGTFTSANGKQIGDYSYGDNALGEVTATSNTMTLPTGLEWVDGEEEGTYVVAPENIVATFGTINSPKVNSTSGIIVNMTKDGVKLTKAECTTQKDLWTASFGDDTIAEVTKVEANAGYLRYTLKGLKAGTTTFTITQNSDPTNKITATITVVNQVSFTTTPSTPRFVENGAVEITGVKFNNETADVNDFTYTSNDETIATIDGTTVTPLKAGTVSVTATSKTDPTLSASANIVFVDAAAKIGDVPYQTVELAMKAAVDGDTVTLQKNVTESINYTNADIEITLDLNGYTLTGKSTSEYALRVQKGVITVTDSSEEGTGAVTYGKNYAFIVDHVANNTVRSKIILESGTFTGKDTVAQAGLSGGSGNNKKYYGGDLEVTGGKFITELSEGQTYDANGNFKYTLNKLDYNASSYPGGQFTPSSIVVKGGTFVNFDPSNNAAEGAATDFVDPDYKANFAEVGANGEYTVVPKVYVAQVGDDKFEDFAEAVAASHADNEAVITPLVNLNELAQPVYTMDPGEVLKVAAVTVDGTSYNVMPVVSDPAYYPSATLANGVYTVTTELYDIKYTSQTGAVSYKMASQIGSPSNGTYQLQKDCSRIRMTPGMSTTDFTIDLNGHTLTCTDSMSGFILSRAGTAASPRKFALVDTSEEKGGVFNYTATPTSSNAAINIKADYNEVTIGEGVTVNGAVYVAAKNDTLIVNGDINGGNDFAIVTNGSGTKNPTITVNNGADITSNTIAMYLPAQGGKTTINAGSTVTGTTAVYIKSGELTINGGTIAATGAKADYTYNGSGANPTGDAIVVDSCGYPGGAPTVTISGNPTVTSTNGKQIGDYAYGNNDLGDVTATSNTMTLPAGLKWVETDTPGVYEVGQKLFVGHNLLLGGDIGVNFYLNPAVLDAYTGTKTVKFTVDGEEATVAVPSTKTDYGYKVTLNVVAARMAHKINAVVYVNGTALAETDSYSVQDYAETVYKDPEAYDTKGKPEQLKALAEAMLHYGGEAQTVFADDLNEKPDHRADKNVGTADYSGVDADAVTAKINGTASNLAEAAAGFNADYYTSSLIYLKNNTLRIYFTPKSKTIGGLDGVNGFTGNLSNYYYYTDKPGIAAAELDNQQSFKVGNVTFNYSALDYVVAVLNSNMTGAQKNLAKSLFQYNQAANAYF